jgi:hypothetical protein
MTFRDEPVGDTGQTMADWLSDGVEMLEFKLEHLTVTEATLPDIGDEMMFLRSIARRIDAVADAYEQGIGVFAALKGFG